MLNWALLIALEQLLDTADLPIIADDLNGMLREIDRQPETSPLGSMPLHVEDVIRAFAAGRRDAAAEQRLRYWARGYFVARINRSKEVRNAR